MILCLPPEHNLAQNANIRDSPSTSKGIAANYPSTIIEKVNLFTDNTYFKKSEL